MSRRYGGRRVARLRELVWSAYPSVCVWCGVGLTFETFTVEHMLPRSRGGSDELPNLRPACGHCNYSRGNRAPPRVAARVDDRAFFDG